MHDSRMDRAISRLISDRQVEAECLFSRGEALDFVQSGFLSRSADERARTVRFIMQSVFESPQALLSAGFKLVDSLIGIDSQLRRYYLIQDTMLDIGCWREIEGSNVVELVATDTPMLSGLVASLKPNIPIPDWTKNVCTYCRKRIVSGTISLLCGGCPTGTCHTSCVPDLEVYDKFWACSPACRDLSLILNFERFIEEIEPLQKAAMRKRRRLASEISALQVHSKFEQATGDSRRSSRGRVSGVVDYSFRDYDQAISNAIRKSEKKSDYYSEEDSLYVQPATRQLSREDRMLMREKRQDLQDVDIVREKGVESMEMPNVDTAIDPIEALESADKEYKYSVDQGVESRLEPETEPMELLNLEIPEQSSEFVGGTKFHQ